jgi:hypothetical protein
MAVGPVLNPTHRAGGDGGPLAETGEVDQLTYRRGPPELLTPERCPGSPT